MKKWYDFSNTWTYRGSYDVGDEIRFIKSVRFSNLAFRKKNERFFDIREGQLGVIIRNNIIGGGLGAGSGVLCVYDIAIVSNTLLRDVPDYFLQATGMKREID